VIRCCGERSHGLRARGLIVVLWRTGLSIQEALDPTELDLDPRRGSVLLRRGKGDHRREVGMDDWGCEQFEPCLEVRRSMPVGPLFASSAAVAVAVLGRRPPRGPTCDGERLAHEGVPLNVVKRQVGHCNLGVTSIYLQGIDPDEIIETVHGRRQPMIPATAGLVLPTGK
jgi:site-specific recombinase XerD